MPCKDIFEAIKKCDLESFKSFVEESDKKGINARTFRKFYNRRVCSDPLTYICWHWQKAINDYNYERNLPETLDSWEKMTDVLLKQGANPLIRVSDNGFTPMHWLFDGIDHGEFDNPNIQRLTMEMACLLARYSPTILTEKDAEGDIPLDKIPYDDLRKEFQDALTKELNSGIIETAQSEQTDENSGYEWEY